MIPEAQEKASYLQLMRSQKNLPTKKLGPALAILGLQQTGSYHNRGVLRAKHLPKNPRTGGEETPRPLSLFFCWFL